MTGQSLPTDYVVGIDIGGTKTVGVVLDHHGQTLALEQFPTARYSPPDVVIRDVASLISRLRASGEPGVCRAVGVGVAGLVTADRKTVIDSIILPAWKDFNLHDAIARECDVPVEVDNDASMALLSEQWLRPPTSTDAVALCLTLGTGVGAAISIGGQILRGPDGTAGQLGHVSIESLGRRCDCGSLGCLNAYVSGTAIAQRYREAIGNDNDIRGGRDVWDAATAGDAVAQNTMRSTSTFLGVALASLVNALNPYLVVLAGGVSMIGEPLIAPALAEMRRRAFPAPAARVDIRVASYGANAVAAGAGAAAWQAVERAALDVSRPARWG